MTVTVRNPILHVYIDGTEVTQRLSARVRYDLAQRVPTAEIVLPTVPSWARVYDPTTGNGSIVTVWMGPDERTAQYRRFVGFIVQIDRAIWPRSVTLLCQGLLLRALTYEQPNPDGVDMADSMAGATDQAQIESVLDSCGLTTTFLQANYAGRSIGGTGELLGTQATDTDAEGNLVGPFTWRAGETALAYIERLDVACYPWRLWEYNGEILRTEIQIDRASPSHTFTEGVDIFSGSASEVWLERKNQITVSGYNDGISGAVTYSYPAVAPTPCKAVAVDSDMIERELAADAGDGLSCEEVAQAMYPDYYRALVKLEMATPSGEVISPCQPIKVQGPGGVVDRLGIAQILWTQAVECEVNDRGEWTQRLSLLGGLSGTTPADSPPLANMSLTLEKETIVSGGSEAALYLAHGRDISTPMGGSITARDWTATGGTPSSGSGEAFTASYSDPAGKTIDLEVTDSNSRTATVSRGVPATGSPLWVRRPLYLAGGTAIECYDGATTRVVVTADSLVVSNGPVWAAGDTVYRSSDYLATAPSSSKPKTGTDVTALWVETDVSANKVLAGLEDGSVYLSLDGGATWTAIGSVGAEVLRVIINRYSTGQYFALTVSGYWDTVDNGASWSNRNPAPVGVTWYDAAHSWDRGYLVVGDDGSGNPYAEDSEGNAQTFAGATAGCYAVTARLLGGYAVILSDGSTWLSESGSASFAAGTGLPAGCTPLPRSLWRDGAIADLYYVAGGTGGVWKSVDGFGSSGGYFQIRKRSVGTARADGDWRQIGADGLVSANPVTPVTVVSTVGTGKCLNLWDFGSSTNAASPDGWQSIGFDDSGWTAPILETKGYSNSLIAGTDLITWEDSGWGGHPADYMEWLHRVSFTVAAGFVSAATLTISSDNQTKAVYVNGVFLEAEVDPAHDGLLTITIPTSLLLVGTNVLAVHVRNGTGAISNPTATNYKLEIS